MRSAGRPDDTFAAPPDPGQARDIDELIERLRLLKVWAGDPSYESIKERVNSAWAAEGRPPGELTRKTTVVDCFRPGRRRLNTGLVVAVVQVLHTDLGYVAQWRQALRVIGGETRAASQVRVWDRLPPDPAGFVGRGANLDRLKELLRPGSSVVVTAIGGMAGVGKTQLAIRAGHLLTREQPFDHVLFVNLRGYHPDAAQPAADPAAVLDGFLRLLGVPGHEIPHGTGARAAAYRDRLAGRRALVILDNAAAAEQVRPLLPDGPGCVTLVTSRRSLTELDQTAHLTVDVFTVEESMAFLTAMAARVPVGDDPDAPARIARRCGHLPLALGLVAAHIAGTSGWTLTDHADRLDERHRNRRLDADVELALDLSYQHLSHDLQRLLRRVALHPGQDFDAYAAAALCGTDHSTAEAALRRLHRDHVLQTVGRRRYTFHDLVRAYATARARDEDPPSERRVALTRLFDYYLGVAAAAMDVVAPAEAHRRPRIVAAGSATPELPDVATARGWLDTERPNLVAMAAHTATHGWPSHTTRLSTILYRYLGNGLAEDALAIHGHARDAAHDSQDLAGHAFALVYLGCSELELGNYGTAIEQLQSALSLFRQVGDRAGEARALNNLGDVEQRLGRYDDAVEHFRRALALHRQAGDRIGEARSLSNVSLIEERLGRYESSAEHYERVLRLWRELGDRTGEAGALNNLGEVEVRLGRFEAAAEHIGQALQFYREIGNHIGEAMSLEGLGSLHTRLGHPARAVEYCQQAIAIFRTTGDRHSEAWTLNSLGDAARAGGDDGAALDRYTAALAIASEIGALDQQARAHAGLGETHHHLDSLAQAHHHYEVAADLYGRLGRPEADPILEVLAGIDAASPARRG